MRRTLVAELAVCVILTACGCSQTGHSDAGEACKDFRSFAAAAAGGELTDHEAVTRSRSIYEAASVSHNARVRDAARDFAASVAHGQTDPGPVNRLADACSTVDG